MHNGKRFLMLNGLNQVMVVLRLHVAAATHFSFFVFVTHRWLAFVTHRWLSRREGFAREGIQDRIRMQRSLPCSCAANVRHTQFWFACLVLFRRKQQQIQQIISSHQAHQKSSIPSRRSPTPLNPSKCVLIFNFKSRAVTFGCRHEHPTIS